MAPPSPTYEEPPEENTTKTPKTPKPPTPTLAEFAAELIASRKPNQELSATLRTVICTLVIAGHSQRELAAMFKISRHSVQHCVTQWTTNQSFEVKPRSGRPPALTKEEQQELAALVRSNPNVNRKTLVTSSGKQVSYSTVKRVLKSHKS